MTQLWQERMSGITLVQAFHATFERRQTICDVGVFADIRDLVAQDNRMEREWVDFKTRSGAGNTDLELNVAIARVERFVRPILAAVTADKLLQMDWEPRKGWVHG